jgi:putative phosphonate metabolism protein
MTQRYAIYYSPSADTLFHRIASEWLGRDAWSGEAQRQPAVEDLAALTAEPRRYGFHATLKAPFQLSRSKTRQELAEFAQDFAHRHAPVLLPKLRLAVLDGFLALVPEVETDHLQQLAACCVMDFDGFRGALQQEEIARRHRAGLSQRQNRLLLNWGYPYVLDQFRFHMTLSNKLNSADMARLATAAETHFSPVIGVPLRLEAITIFCEAAAGAPFRAEERFALTGKADAAWPEIWKLGVR